MKSNLIFIPSEWKYVKEELYLRADGSTGFRGNMNAGRFKIENLAPADFDNDAVNKQWVDQNTLNEEEFTNLTSKFIRSNAENNVDMSNARIVKLGMPVHSTDAVSKQWVDQNTLNEEEFTNLTSKFIRTNSENNVDMNSGRILKLGMPVDSTDAVNKQWVEENTLNKKEGDTLIENLNFLKLDSDNNLDMNNSRVVNLGLPQVATDAVNKSYCDGNVLFMYGQTVIDKNKQLKFYDLRSNLSEMSKSLVAQSNASFIFELWLRLKENKSTAFTMTFLKDEEVIFSKYYSYEYVQVENSSEFLSFIEYFKVGNKLVVNVAANRNVDITYYLRISRLQIQHE